MTSSDPGSEDYVWPEISELRPADAVRLLDDVSEAATAANKRSDLLKKRKAQAKAIALAVLEDYELDTAATTTATGQRVQYTPYSWDVFSIDDEDAFRKWEGAEAESYFDSSPNLRDGVFRDEMRRRVQDGEALPPGVKRWTDTKISRTATKKPRAT